MTPGGYGASSPLTRPSLRPCPKAQRRSVTQRPFMGLEANPHVCTLLLPLVCWRLFRVRPQTTHCRGRPPRVPPTWSSSAGQVAPSVQNKWLPRTVSLVSHRAYVGVFLLNESLEVKPFGQREGARYLDRICQIPLRGRGPRLPDSRVPAPAPTSLPTQSAIESCLLQNCRVRCHRTVLLACISVVISKDEHLVVR